MSIFFVVGSSERDLDLVFAFDLDISFFWIAFTIFSKKNQTRSKALLFGGMDNQNGAGFGTGFGGNSNTFSSMFFFEYMVFFVDVKYK